MSAFHILYEYRGFLLLMMIVLGDFLKTMTGKGWVE